MASAVDSLLLRESAMTWLDTRPSAEVDFVWLSGFEFAGVRIPLMDRQRGIRKPAVLDEALSIRTTFTPPGATPPYADAIGADGLQRYKYRGDDPLHPENVALRRAFERQLPLIWFVGVAPALYEPIYPVWVVGDDPRHLEFALALDVGQRFVTPGAQLDRATKAYVERLTRQRLHQRVFRTQVLLAYDGRCTVCNLGHSELLDAAHISPTDCPTATLSSPMDWPCAGSTTPPSTASSSASGPISRSTSVETSSSRRMALCFATAFRRCTTADS